MKNPITLSVGIACFNEEKTITQLLEAIRAQKGNQFILQEIMVISDGSTDATVAACRKVHDTRITVYDEKVRKGKATRLNELCRKMESDIIVLLDGDITITDSTIFSYLMQPFLNNPNTGLVGGNPTPKPGKTFIERAVNITYLAYAPLRSRINNGSNPHGCDGKIVALSHKFAKTITIPPTMIGTDSYLYFLCITRGFTFQHVPEAIVYYRSPATLRDQIKQNIRFIGAEYMHRDIFGELVEKEYFVEPRLYRSLLFKQFMLHPISATTIFLINKYCRYRAKKTYKTFDVKWPMIMTTKG